VVEEMMAEEWDEPERIVISYPVEIEDEEFTACDEPKRVPVLSHRVNVNANEIDEE
jgi:hypothetical protein